MSRLNIILFILCVGVIALIALATGGDRSQPNYEFIPNMKHSPAYSAYAPNPNLPDHRTLQPPVAGTIARGEMPLHYAPTPADAVRAGEELINPFAFEAPKNPAAMTKEEQALATKRLKLLNASISRGGNVFRVSCVPCHGGSGRGDGPVVKRGYPAPSESLATGASTKMKDGQLFHIITYGKYPETEKTPPRFTRMPSFAPQLTPKQRWDVINYIRSMQADKATEPAEPTAQGEAGTANKTEAADSTTDSTTEQPDKKVEEAAEEKASEAKGKTEDNTDEKEAASEAPKETPEEKSEEKSSDASPAKEEPTEEAPKEPAESTTTTDTPESEDSTSEEAPAEESSAEESSADEASSNSNPS